VYRCSTIFHSGVALYLALTMRYFSLWRYFACPRRQLARRFSMSSGMRECCGPALRRELVAGPRPLAGPRPVVPGNLYYKQM
jgi:hypothetical protein